MKTEKINKELIGELKSLCTIEFLGHINNFETRKKIIEFIFKFFNHKKQLGLSYLVYNVKCDEENNPPVLVDSNQANVLIYEYEDLSKRAFFIHPMTLP